MSFDYLFSLYRLEYCHYCVTQRQIYPPIQFLMNQSNYLFKYAYSNLHIQICAYYQIPLPIEFIKKNLHTN